MEIGISKQKGKRFFAKFPNGKTVHFGSEGGRTYIDEGNKAKRDAYLKRHIVNENWNDPFSPGSLSRYLLWGEYTSLEKNQKAFMKKFPITTKG
jgi:hypothetical protein